jgi:hypothetical protein
MKLLGICIVLMSCSSMAQLNPRDYGVDCTGRTDSSAALNEMLKQITHRTVHFEDCQVRVDHTAIIFGQSSFKLIGDNVPGPGGTEAPRSSDVTGQLVRFFTSIGPCMVELRDWESTQ